MDCVPQRTQSFEQAGGDLRCLGPRLLPSTAGGTQGELFPLSLDDTSESFLNTIVTTSCLQPECKKIPICLLGLDVLLKACPLDSHTSLLLP